MRAMIWPVLIALVPLSLLLAITLGSSGWHWPWGADDTMTRVMLELRLPRAIAALVTGSLLAVAGCLMQVLLRNPLADPYILGLSGGAAAFALAGMMLGLSWLPVPLLAFAGALLTTLVVFVLARGRGPWSTTRVLLTGVVVASGWGALISLMLATGPDASLRSMLYWLMGDLSYAGLSAWWLLPLVVGLALLWLRSRSLNVMSAGQLQATLLGESSRSRFWEIYLIASLLTGLAVAIAGAIGFVGLNRASPDAPGRRGRSFVACCPPPPSLVARFWSWPTPWPVPSLSPRQLPVGVLTALIGVPLFLLLLNRAVRIR